MKHIVIGTAGHVDHGKTQLTLALTGVDTDRLAEEKARGITIELGFAPLKLADGSVVSIVDVPGHERFVKTMISGASGIDAALLVVDANEGVKPQTVEHLEVLQLLGVHSGILVLTKCDLVDEARLAQSIREVRQLVKGTTLEQAEHVAVSAVTGQGMVALRANRTALVAQVQARNERRPARLNVDRVFQREGFGNIATGTLTDGTFCVGDAVQLYPQGDVGTVRTLQNHGKSGKQVTAGIRTAMSLSGMDRSALQRGSILAQPGSMVVTDMLDVYIQITPSCPWKIRNASQVHVCHATREVVGKLRLLSADALSAAQSGYAQLKLSQPIAVRNGDRFLIRFFSPVLTVAGGIILDAQAVRRRRGFQPVLQRLKVLNGEDAIAAMLQRVTDRGVRGADEAQLRAHCNLSPEEYQQCISPAVENGALLRIRKGWLHARTALEERSQAVQTMLARYHAEFPLQPGMRLPELRTRAFPEQIAAADEILTWYETQGCFNIEQGYVSLPDFVPVFTQQHKIMQRKLLHFYRDAWLQPPSRGEVDHKFRARGEIYPQVLANMRLNGLLIALSGKYLVHHEAYAAALATFRAMFETQNTVTLAQFRTAAGISRKYAQLFLEHWDSVGICRRQGDARVLVINDP